MARRISRRSSPVRSVPRQPLRQVRPAEVANARRPWLTVARTSVRRAFRCRRDRPEKLVPVAQQVIHRLNAPRANSGVPQPCPSAMRREGHDPVTRRAGSRGSLGSAPRPGPSGPTAKRHGGGGISCVRRNRPTADINCAMEPRCRSDIKDGVPERLHGGAGMLYFGRYGTPVSAVRVTSSKMPCRGAALCLSVRVTRASRATSASGDCDT